MYRPNPIIALVGPGRVDRQTTLLNKHKIILPQISRQNVIEAQYISSSVCSCRITAMLHKGQLAKAWYTGKPHSIHAIFKVKNTVIPLTCSEDEYVRPSAAKELVVTLSTGQLISPSTTIKIIITCVTN